MKRIVLLSLTCALVIACQDQRSPTAAKPPSFQLLQGGHDHFFFLPPIVPQRTFTGTFNPALKPIVVICQLVVDANNIPLHCADTPPIDPGPVTADLAGQHYKVNWDTRQSGILSNLFYRIQVFASPNGVLLGFADVDPVSNGSQLKNVNTGEYIGLVDGRTLPIKFRIERGAFGTNCTSDCAEANVSTAGGIVVTNTGFAGASFPSGWLPEGFTNVVVTIERVNLGTLDASCIPLNQPQAEGCYRFKTFPDVGTFALEVTAGLCVEIEHVAQHDAAQLFKVEEFIGEGGGISLGVVTALENAPATFVSCEGFASAALRPGLFADVTRALRRMGTWLAPSSAYAAHVGVGGLTGSFSRIGWMLPTTINFDEVTAGTPVNTLYGSQGVLFGRTRPGAFCSAESSGNEVFANDHGPLPGGGFGFNSGNNVVTVCPEGTSSDFSEDEAGRIEASFDFPMSKVCINAYPTSFHGGIPGSIGLLVAFNGQGQAIQTVTTAPGVAHVLCVESAGPNAPGIFSVQFAGSGAGLAIFDNLSFTAGPPLSD